MLLLPLLMLLQLKVAFSRCWYLSRLPIPILMSGSHQPLLVPVASADTGLEAQQPDATQGCHSQCH
jgi:hypothetical protein